MKTSREEIKAKLTPGVRVFVELSVSAVENEVIEATMVSQIATTDERNHVFVFEERFVHTVVSSEFAVGDKVTDKRDPYRPVEGTVFAVRGLQVWFMPDHCIEGYLLDSGQLRKF